MKLARFSLVVYQILGGILGLVFSFMELKGNLSYIAGLTGLLYALAGFLYSFSIFCGIKLITSFAEGISFSRYNQCLQLIVFAVFGYGYSYAAGFKFLIGFDATSELRLFYKYSLSDWRFMINSSSEASYIAINIMALAVILLIEVLAKRTYQSTSYE